MANISYLPLRVDPDLQALIPPLREEEYSLLSASLRDEGCREPLAVWFHPTTPAWCDWCEADVTITLRYGYPVEEFLDQDDVQVWFLACVTCEHWLAELTEDPSEGDKGEEAAGDRPPPCVLLDGTIAMRSVPSTAWTMMCG
jgi:hypothetical protein